MIRVAVVEDIPSIRKKYVHMFDGSDRIEVVGEASSGYEAIGICALTKPDVVLMDIEMESATAGIDASKTILSQFPHIRIVILTVHDRDEMIYDAFKVGVCDYLLKDADKQAVTKCIIDAYNGQSPIRPTIANRIRQEYQRVKTFEGDALYNMYLMKLLTESEIDILCLYNEGKTRNQICQERFIGMQTLKTHTRNILGKFKKPSIDDVLIVLRQCNFFDCLENIKSHDYVP